MNDTNKFVIVLRWVLLLPASVLGAWLIYIITLFLNRWGSSLYMGHNSIWYYLAEILANVSMGMAFIFIGTYIAPKWKKIVAIVLFTLYCILMGGAIVFNFINGFEWMPFISSISTIVGACVVLYHVSQTDEENM